MLYANLDPSIAFWSTSAWAQELGALPLEAGDQSTTATIAVATTSALDATLSIPVVPGYGPAGYALFALAMEAGTSLRLEWATDVIKSMSGAEQRIATLSTPRMSYRGTAILIDGESAGERVIRTQLQAGSLTPSPFWLGLPFEELIINTDSPGGVLSVNSTTFCDWANPGQYVACVGLDGSVSISVVQSKGASTLNVFPVPSASTTKAGSSVLPLATVYLDPRQGLGRYPVNVTEWSIDARSALYGYAGQDTFGLGVSVDEYELTNGDEVAVFDRYLGADGSPVGDSVHTLAEIIDLGGVPQGLNYQQSVPESGREIRIVGASGTARYQWLKKFLFNVRGRQKKFVLPTWRPNLVFVSVPGPTLMMVQSSSVTGNGDYVAWFNSSANNYLQLLKTDGSVQYVGVDSAGDNFDGTVTLQLTESVTGTIQMISFLEVARLETDVVEITFEGNRFSTSFLARVVQR